MRRLGFGYGISRAGRKLSSRNWTPLTLVVEDAQPTHVVITFPSAKIVLASDFTIAGFTVLSGSWSGSVYTLVLSTAVVYGDSLTVVYSGKNYVVTNNVADVVLTVEDYTDNLTLHIPFTDAANPYALTVGSGNFVFSRVTGATYVDPTTGLIKFAKGNRLINSEVPSGWAGNTAVTVTDNTAGTTDPLGGNTAAKVVETNAFSAILAQSWTPTVMQTATHSVYLKYGSCQWVRLSLYSTAGSTNAVRAWVDLQNGTLGTGAGAGNGTYAGHSITAVGDGWYRATVSGNISGGITTYGFSVITADGDNSTTRAGVNKFYYLWGAQAMDMLRSPEYIKTTTAVISTLRIESNGALFEGTRKNLCLQSEVFKTTWVASNITIADNSAVSPDGLTTADTLTAGAGNGTLLQTIATAADSYTFSVYLKRKTGTGNIDITANGGTTWVTKTINSTTWTRCQLTAVRSAETAASAGIRIVTDTDAVYAWGAQYELGFWASSYIPTANLAHQRNLDTMYLDTITGNVDSTNGTCYAVVDVFDTAKANKFFIDLQAPAALPCYIRCGEGIGSGGVLGRTTVFDGSEVSYSSVNIQPNTVHKVAGVWNVTTSKMGTTADGADVVDGAFDGDLKSAGYVPARIGFGDSYNMDGSRTLWGHVKELRIWSDAKAYSDLKTITI